MAELEAREGAARVRVGVRRPLAGQVREEVEAVAAGRDLGRPGHQVLEGAAGGEGVAQPAQAPGRRQHHPHHVPAVGHGVTEGVHPARRLDGGAVGGGEHHSRGAERQRHHPGPHRPHADGVGGLVAPSRHHRGPGGQAGGLGRPPAPPAGDPGAFEGGREPGRVQVESRQDLR